MRNHSYLPEQYFPLPTNHYTIPPIFKILTDPHFNVSMLAQQIKRTLHLPEKIRYEANLFDRSTQTSAKRADKYNPKNTFNNCSPVFFTSLDC